ncbi:hypothetical protein GC194_15655 [bacterium]|nr:hypothetical protein [bacterium]
MRKTTAIAFALLFALQAILPQAHVGCELRKIPGLWRHYLEHKAFDGDSFIEFLTEDYFGDTGEIEEHHNSRHHNDLPFRGDHQCCHIVIFLTPSSHSNHFCREEAMLQQSTNPYNLRYSAGFTSVALNPPRLS